MPSLTEIMSAMPTATQGWQQQEAEQARLAQLAAQTEGQQIMNQQAQLEMETYQANEELRGLNRQLQVMEAERKARPEYQAYQQKLMDMDIRNKLSSAELQEMQGMLDAFSPIYNSIKNNDIQGLTQGFQQLQNSPHFARMLEEEPAMGQLMQAAANGDPQAVDSLIQSYEDLQTIVAAPASRQAAADEAKAAREQAGKIELERVKGEEARKTERVKQESPTSAKYGTFKAPTPQEVESMKEAIEQVWEESGKDKLELFSPSTWGMDIDSDVLANKFSLDYNWHVASAPKGQALSVSDFIRQELGVLEQMKASTPLPPGMTDDMVNKFIEANKDQGATRADAIAAFQQTRGTQ